MWNCLLINLNGILFDRHTELFRSCNSNSDYEAKNHIQEWKKGFIQMPNILIPIQDIKKCLPDTWKVFPWKNTCVHCVSFFYAWYLCESSNYADQVGEDLALFVFCLNMENLCLGQSGYLCITFVSSCWMRYYWSGLPAYNLPVPLYTHGWSESTMSVIRHLTQECKSVTPARSWTDTLKSGLQHSNHLTTTSHF